MTAKEYADSIKLDRLTPDKSGFYTVNMDLIHAIASGAFMAGESAGAKKVHESMTKVYRNMVTISQRNGVTG